MTPHRARPALIAAVVDVDGPRPVASASEVRVAELRERRHQLVAQRASEMALEKFCRDRMCQHEERVRVFDGQLDAIDEELFEKWKVAP